MNEYGVRFTDETYATRKDISTMLGTSLIDSIYREVLSYRQGFGVKTSLLTLDRKSLFITRTAVLANKFIKFGEKLNQFADSISSLANYGDLFSQFKRFAFARNLKDIAAAEKISISDATVSAITTSFYTLNDPSHKSLLGYFDFLNRLVGSTEVGEEFLANAFAAFRQEDELTSFYRNADLHSLANQAIISTVYEFAPNEKIELLMSLLWDYLKNDRAVSYIKSLVAMYYCYYVKPFGEDNAMAAIAVAKGILNEGKLTGFASLLPLEEALRPKERLTSILNEVQRNGDLTYFVLYAIDAITPVIDEYLDKMAAAKQKALLDERNFVTEPSVETEKEAQTELPIEPLQTSLKEETPAKEETQIEEQVEIPLKEVERIDKIPETSSGDRALKRINENDLSDKELKSAAKYILETNPNIKKAQALFYAGHCTLGRYYSIQDYKKAAKCAYETARTSMDALANYGFYKKLAIKNKFVYTPIKQGD